MTRSGRRRAVVATAAVAGVVTGALLAFAMTDPRAPDEPAAAAPVARPTTAAPPAASDQEDDPSTDAPRPSSPDVLLVWTAGALPPGLATEIAALDGVTGTTVVRGDETAMVASWDADGRPVDETAPGWHLPLDTLAVDPDTFSSFLPPESAEAIGSLAPGQAVLTSSSDRLRRLGVGGRIRVGENEVTVAGVVDDHAGAGAEMLVTAEDADRLGVTTERYLLVAHRGSREALQQALADRLDGRAVRFRSPAETTWLRHGDAVQPPLVLKTALGEFAIRDRTDRDIEIDPAWVARSIATEVVPILGPVTCHRAVIPPLRAVMAELEQDGLAHLVDPAAFAGCFARRRTGAGQPLSHHAWGAALDLNVDGNPRGSFSTQDPRLVATFARHGFTWGGTWLVPDPAHYEAPLATGEPGSIR